MTCKTCRFWSPIQSATWLGECHQYGPCPQYNYQQRDVVDFITSWPVTDKGDFCPKHLAGSAP